MGDEILFTKIWRACRITQIHVSSVTYICTSFYLEVSLGLAMYVMYRIIYSFSSDFVSNLKMAIRAETCS